MAQSKLYEEYGLWKVVTTSQRGGFGGGAKTVYHVQYGSDESERLEMGKGKAQERNAKTLAATLEAAGATGFDALPPEFGPALYSDDEWEKWAGENNAVPTKVAVAGKAPLAGYLKVVHREREGWIAGRLGVEEKTVRQYLSDLREGHR